MKTVIHKGKEYQIGGIYGFSDGDHVVCVGELESITSDGFLKKYGVYWSEVTECKAPLGTIKETSIELEDGAAYQFDFGSNPELLLNIGLIGTYDGNGATGCFWIKDTPWYTQDCTNIVKLVPEVK
tara:strand:+ start:11662 stop:12039 length:378 start_codon:yes stop_codon:yes gene_type:complete